VFIRSFVHHSLTAHGYIGAERLEVGRTAENRLVKCFRYTEMLKLYSELADWWHLLSPLAEYAEEVEVFWNILSGAGLPEDPTLLELGCGGGNNAFYLKQHFSQVILTDLSPGMLAVSRGINPDCEHLQGDMRSLRLGRIFDVVFVHDAVTYMTTLEDLRQAIETAFLHCKPGGCALFVPDCVSETFQPETSHGGVDGEGRSMRYLQWSYDPDPNDTQYFSEMVYLLHEDGQPMRIEHDQHICGLFPRADWLRLLGEAGFQVDVSRDKWGRDLFLGRK
jgi:SAM-dependent methyltransferase